MRKTILKRKKQEKGITLMTLIITIIVLIILAAISIAALSGDNGMIKKTLDTSDKTKELNLREELDLTTVESTSDGGRFLEDVFKEKIQYKGWSILKETDQEIEVKKDGYKGKVEKTTGEIILFQKEGTENEPTIDANLIIKSVYTYYDETETIVPNVKFSIYTDIGCKNLYKGNLSTDESGICTIDLPSAGEYFIMLDESLEGYYECVLSKIEVTSKEEDQTCNIHLSARLVVEKLKEINDEDTYNVEFNFRAYQEGMQEKFDINNFSGYMSIYKIGSYTKEGVVTYEQQWYPHINDTEMNLQPIKTFKISEASDFDNFKSVELEKGIYLCEIVGISGRYGIIGYTGFACPYIDEEYGVLYDFSVYPVIEADPLYGDLEIVTTVPNYNGFGLIYPAIVFYKIERTKLF